MSPSNVPLGLEIFRRGERYAKRAGKLKRSGLVNTAMQTSLGSVGQKHHTILAESYPQRCGRSAIR